MKTAKRGRKDKDSAKVGVILKDSSSIEGASIHNIRDVQKADKRITGVVNYMTEDKIECGGAAEKRKVEGIKGQVVLLGEGDEQTLYTISHAGGGKQSLMLLIPEGGGSRS